MPAWVGRLNVIRSSQLVTMSSLGPSKNPVSCLCPCGPFTSETSVLLGENSMFSAEDHSSVVKCGLKKIYQDQVLGNKLSVEFFHCGQ